MWSNHQDIIIPDLVLPSFLRIFGCWFYFWQLYKTKRPRGLKKKKKQWKNQTHYGPNYLRASGICIFFEQCKQRCLSFGIRILLCLPGHYALWISSISVILAPHPPSAGFLWLLPSAFVPGLKTPKSLLEIPLPAFSLVCPAAFRSILSDVSLGRHLKPNT